MIVAIVSSHREFAPRTIDAALSHTAIKEETAAVLPGALSLPSQYSEQNGASTLCTIERHVLTPIRLLIAICRRQQQEGRSGNSTRTPGRLQYLDKSDTESLSFRK